MTKLGSLFDGIQFPYISPLQFSDSLMTSFAMQTENVIKAEIEKFKKNGIEEEEIEICSEEGIYEHVEYYYGLTSQEVMLEEIFTEYFPSLNRRSAFQTIYSTYEVELQDLCRHYQKSLGGKSFNKYPDTGILKVKNFVDKKLPNLRDCPEWKAVNQLRLLRNSCIHNDGKAYKNNGSSHKEINMLIDSNSKIFHHDGLPELDASGEIIKYSSGGNKRKGRYVIFENGSLDYVIETFKAYVKVLSEEFKKIQPRT